MGSFAVYAAANDVFCKSLKIRYPFLGEQVNHNYIAARLADAITAELCDAVKISTHCSRHPRTKNHARVFQTPRNDGHVLECGGAPPLLRKMRVSFRPRLPRRSKSGGAPPHSKTQAKLGAANDALRNLSKISTNSLRHPPHQESRPRFQTPQDDPLFRSSILTIFPALERRTIFREHGR